ncbi:MAG: rod-binding protein [Betaproteobacteria bacterium]|jgi:flagellar protein FlgJ
MYSPSSLDSNYLSQLKADASRDPDQNIDKVSKQFEAIFINMLIKTMRQSVVKSGLFESDAQKTYQSLFDQEISRELADSESFGLSEVIKTQLAPRSPRRLAKEGYGLAVQDNEYKPIERSVSRSLEI